jgi:hypothetical protein
MLDQAPLGFARSAAKRTATFCKPHTPKCGVTGADTRKPPGSAQGVEMGGVASFLITMRPRPTLPEPGHFAGLNRGLEASVKSPRWPFSLSAAVGSNLTECTKPAGRINIG